MRSTFTTHPRSHHLTMNLRDNSPLLRSSLDSTPPPESVKRQLNRSMSLRAALLAFPLPNPSDPNRPIRRHSTRVHRPSALRRYNSNYQRLSQERLMRVKTRRSELYTSPVYAMPSTFDEIQKTFPATRRPASRSVFVEPDMSLPILDVPVIPSVRQPIQRETLCRTGSIARKQRLRKKARAKPSGEISRNILRSTTSALKGTLHKARDALSATSRSVSRLFTGWKRGKEKKDDFHKYLYDLHSREEGSAVTGSVVSLPVFGSVERKGTWTNLSSVMGLEKDEMKGLETIQEITEISDCGKTKENRSFQSVAKFLHSLTEKKSVDFEENMAMDSSRKPSHISIHSGRSQRSSQEYFIQNRSSQSLVFLGARASFEQVKLTPPHSPAESTTTPSPLKPLSTQGLFTVPSSTAYSEGIDPVKPSISTQHSIQAEITRSSSCILKDLQSKDETAPETRVIANQNENVSGEERERLVSVMSRDVSTYSQGTDVENSEVLQTEAEKSIPIIEAWKWAPSSPKRDPGQESDDKGRSVRDRVRELDLAINSAMNIEHGQRPGKRGMFARWRG